jgi:hypothetical protein
VRKGEKPLTRRLAEIEERIANGERQIAQQRKLVAKLEAKGRPATHAKYLLQGSSCSNLRGSRTGLGYWSSLKGLNKNPAE